MLFSVGRVGRQTLAGSGLLPSMDLNFLSGTLNPNITFTRAAGPATYFDVTGTMQTVGANVPRFDYDPVTHAPRGLLMEETRTNLLLWSTDISNAAWTVFNGATVGGAVTGPDGTLSGRTINFAAQALSQVLQSAAFPANTTVSVYARANTANTFLIRYSNDGNSSIFNLTAQWQRFSFTTAGVGNSNVAFCNSAGAAGSIDIAAPQLEVGTFATSYIPTTTATQQRPAESAILPIGSWWTQNNGTYTAEFMMSQPAAAGTQAGIFRADDTTNNNSLVGFVGTGGGIFATATIATVLQLNNAASSLAANTIHKLAATIGGGLNWRETSNGATPQTGSGAATALFTRVALCSSSSIPTTWTINGWLRRFAFIPATLSNPQLQQITT